MSRGMTWFGQIDEFKLNYHNKTNNVKIIQMVKEVLKMATKRIEYTCSHCGKKEIRFVSMGKPQPGKCPRKKGDKPHSWTVNRKFDN